MSIGKTFDLKVGYTCNNDCIHCVVKPDYREWKKKGIPLDVPYGEIIELMNSKEFIDANQIVLTGGEATIRKELMRIIKYIHINYPQKMISLQTNGRKLKQYLPEIHSNNININYTIALHGTQDVHNRVTQVEGVDTYSQTMDSIYEIQRLYGDFNRVARIEIVLSRLNYKNIPLLVEKLYLMNIKNIGISYPHMDGFANIDISIVREISISYPELKELIFNLYNMCITYEDLILIFEEFPRCVWRTIEGALLPLPNNVRNMTHNDSEQVSVKFPNRELNDNFITTFKNMHQRAASCNNCCNTRCFGTWWEAIKAFGEEQFIPITSKEMEGIELCTY